MRWEGEGRANARPGRQVLQSMCQQLQRLTPHMEDLMFGMETGQGAGLVRDLFSVFSSELAKEDYNLFEAWFSGLFIFSIGWFKHVCLFSLVRCHRKFGFRAP